MEVGVVRESSKESKTAFNVALRCFLKLFEDLVGCVLFSFFCIKSSVLFISSYSKTELATLLESPRDELLAFGDGDANVLIWSLKFEIGKIVLGSKNSRCQMGLFQV